METRQLAYFLLACQQQNHAAAAASLGISASTLSESLNALEAELGFGLFHAGSAGRYPSFESRLLYQPLECFMRNLAALERHGAAALARPLALLNVRSPMKFTLGRLSKAAAAAAWNLQAGDPGLFVDIAFAPPPATNAYEDFFEPAEAAVQGGADVLIDYDYTGGARENGVLHEVPWVAILNGRASGRVADGQGIEGLLHDSPVFLPVLPQAGLDAARAYCRRVGVTRLQEQQLDAGGLPGFAADDRALVMLAPRSMVSSRISQHLLAQCELPVAFVTTIAAFAVSAHPAAAGYIRALKRALDGPESVVAHRPRIALRQLRLFLTLQDHPSVTLAARQLHLTQPAASAQLSGLERTLGVRLFDRSRKGLTPTVSAPHAAARLARLAASLDEALHQGRRLVGAQRSRLVLGMVPASQAGGVLVRAVSSAITEWQRMNPSARVQVLEAPAAVLEEWTRDGRLNIALVDHAGPRTPRLLLGYRDRLGLVTHPSTAGAPAAPLPLAALQDLPLILPSRHSGLRLTVDSLARAAGITFAVVQEVDSFALAAQLAGSTRVATVLPHEAVREAVARGELHFAPLAGQAAVELTAIYSSEQKLAPATHAFLSLLKAALARGYRDADTPG